MAKESLDNVARIAASKESLGGYPKALLDIIRELQGVTFTPVAGATAATNIPVTDIATEDTLVGVLSVDFAGGAIANLIAEASITSAGNIQCATTDTSAAKLIVVWLNKSG